LFLLYVYKISREGTHLAGDEPRMLSTSRSVVYIVLGVAGLYLGGGWVVDGAVGIALAMNVDDALIGLTIVAVGTSTPEIVASAVAAYRNQTDIAVGNVVGSNIFNILWVLGFTSSLVELPFEVVNNTDLVMVICSSALILLALITSRNNSIMWSHGVIFIALYAGYIFYVTTR
jgi:cation:H+ antiporter